MGAALLEQHEQWQLEGRQMFSAESMATIPELRDIPNLQAPRGSRPLRPVGFCSPDPLGAGAPPLAAQNTSAHNTSAIGRKT